MFKLTLLLCDNMLVSSSTLASEIFHFAQAMAKGKKLVAPELEIRRVSADGQPVKTSSGFELTPTHHLDQCDDNNLIHIRCSKPAHRAQKCVYIPGTTAASDELRDYSGHWCLFFSRAAKWTTRHYSLALL